MSPESTLFLKHPLQDWGRTPALWTARVGTANPSGENASGELLWLGGVTGNDPGCGPRWVRNISGHRFSTDRAHESEARRTLTWRFGNCKHRTQNATAEGEVPVIQKAPRLVQLRSSFPALHPPPCSGPGRTRPAHTPPRCISFQRGQKKVQKGPGLWEGKMAAEFAGGSSALAPCPYFSFLPDLGLEDCHSARGHLGHLQPEDLWGRSTVLVILCPPQPPRFLGTTLAN